MKLNTKDPQRTLHAYPLNGVDGDGFILTERLRHVPCGCTKAVWEEERVFMSNQEILKLARLVGGAHE
jgi:hypothetical protein